MHVVIFCGGYGTRMWPVSRKGFPKQFYPFVDGKSFFELTYKRFRKAFSPKDIFTSSEKLYTPYIRKIAPEIPKENFIEEPERRDNLGAIGLATAILEKRYPGEVMVVSWCDQIVEKEGELLKAIKSAGEYAKETGLIVSVDEEPSYPSVHNGWVKLGHSIDEFNGYTILKITKHIEKPNEALAKRMYIEGGYLLNTGYRSWRTDVMMGYFKEFQPEIYNGLAKIVEGSGKSFRQTILYREYHKFKKDSIESGIFEKLGEDKRVTISIKMGWKDAGTWELFYKARKKKEEANVSEGQAVFLDAENNLVVSSKDKMVSLIGVSGLAVIDTPSGLLVTDLTKTDKVKELFAMLEKEKPQFVE